ncbi:methyltransferase domain-containing protein [Spiractinospora alimapuensis]|uniref:protein-L-isoaspartate O-methyltransferase family protein n=1 Tax=Spiractinospora alimapuensis TaxID=2820884 RepID=UPI001F370895|nr:methyltransferase domain-containing protein [Spiractinospora alimapuensis]QVQ50633.1 methyltransferase domain-containing protein [Spiractinospora alimapuensis]
MTAEAPWACVGTDWAAALAAAPREWFVPDVAWTTGDGLLDRQADPQGWWAAIARDDAIVTQIDDGRTELTDDSPWTTLDWTSSCSAPNMVFDFLRLLDPYPGDRVLEVGTGTGWTAALLSARLGAEWVTSIDIDASVAAAARARLECAEFTPTLLVGDGAEGHPAGAPFDRVHVTCGVSEIPPAWVEQTRPGGVIVLPWMPFHSGGYKVRLVVADDERAVGRIHGTAAYMPMRAQRLPRTSAGSEATRSRSRIDPRRIDAGGDGFRIAVLGLLGGVTNRGGGTNPVDGTFRYVLIDGISDSHAIAIQPPSGGPAEVRQRGPRRLWDELESAYLQWVGWGEPSVDRLGVTVNRAGQHVWLDSPNNPLTEVPHGRRRQAP